jgi:hypothetical protein
MKFYADRNADKRLLDELRARHGWDIDLEMLRGSARREAAPLCVMVVVGSDPCYNYAWR